jgi:hypothetical protein
MSVRTSPMPYDIIIFLGVGAAIAFLVIRNALR